MRPPARHIVAQLAHAARVAGRAALVEQSSGRQLGIRTQARRDDIVIGLELGRHRGAAAPRDGLRKASRPPLELLTGNNVVYVFNFKDSAKGGAAKAQCDNQNDPAAARECLNTERGKINRAQGPVEAVIGQRFRLQSRHAFSSKQVHRRSES